MNAETPYAADRSLYGKLRRRYARLVHTRPASLDLRRPMITFSFDDAPASSADHGARILENYGARGTYFISSGLMGTQSHLGTFAGAEALQRLSQAGHEIACHTYNHFDCGRGKTNEIAAELERNREAFRAMRLPDAQTFAYPYGDVSPQAKAVLGSRFAAARALHHGVITSGSDLNQAPAVGIEGSCGELTAQGWMKTAHEARGWLVLYTHDVRDQPSDWGCTPQVLERLVAKARDMRFEIVTFAEGVRRAAGHAAAEAA
ncbi:polysaccharide deacetylase family protein [Asticcacaulis sp. EMRT-3]|uniref:polysaccharide deacetylase family protein n=1 Tax=Asticcacaulis sp. EMRT-3 TaxID=3040349 RepID=UPI0024AF8875|nr:polysaccharide deacetylase family protein [Asticcacaulis sp. EMRT-3]MDI7774732.1 polysaccharide deacetylase family protein [Asticcacaulis sp. EMRT-3]